MYEFAYRRPAALAEAVAALAADEDARLMAGGQTLIPTLKQRLANPSTIVDLNAVPDLAGIRRDGDRLVVGALARHADVAASDVVRTAIPALADLAGAIGDPAVRNRGTLGGSIANADPAADYPAALLGLGATVHTSARTIPADEFFTGLFATALGASEIVTAVSFPVPERAAYARLPNPASRYAVVGVFVSRGAGGVRVAVTGAASSVFRVAAMETALAACFDAAAIEGVTVPADELNEDIHATAEYRGHLVGVMARRAVRAAAG